MSLKDAFAGLGGARETSAAKAKAEAKAEADPYGMTNGKEGARETGRSSSRSFSADKVIKSGNPDYEQVKVYLPVGLKRRAWRKWEDAGGGDLSDLVRKLMEQYLGT